MRTLRRVSVFVAVVLCAPAFGSDEIRPANSPAAPYWMPGTDSAGKETGTRRPKKELAAPARDLLALPSAALPFIAIPPCRIADTRDATFSATFGPPALVGGGPPRTFAIPAGPCPGIPATAAAYSLNFTVVAPVGTPQGGYLSVWPADSPQPVVSTLNFTSNSILANAAIVSAGTGGAINTYVNFSTDVIIDINGYYAPEGVFSHLIAVGAVFPTGTVRTGFTNLGTWTVSRAETGTYEITFAGLRPGCTPGNLPTVQLTTIQPGFIFSPFVTTDCASGDTTISVFTRSTADLAADSLFTFSVYGTSPMASSLTTAVDRRIASTCTFTASTGVETCE